jgi:hypothetical protein
VPVVAFRQRYRAEFDGELAAAGHGEGPGPVAVRGSWVVLPGEGPGAVPGWWRAAVFVVFGGLATAVADRVSVGVGDRDTPLAVRVLGGRGGESAGEVGVEGAEAVSFAVRQAARQPPDLGAGQRPAAQQLPDHPELGRDDPRFLGSPPAQQADQLIIGGAGAGPVRAGQLIEDHPGPRPGRAGVPGVSLCEGRQPRVPAAGQPGVATGLLARAASGDRRLCHGNHLSVRDDKL